ncbi:hypothetical protein RFW18_16405 [Metabacillus idriensis]|uniref:hypothetical protein n=1 Tax=Bacillaceae TaxID=186817 RepID=UPI0010594BDE|nr:MULTISPECIES: hypothetical protein [Bacillaceae]MDR0139337.1 hypothetical protein [Metabacillus idriensis]TDL77862.1 hypothetical protein E2R53_18380 [Peribacillus frigoritolerans]
MSEFFKDFFLFIGGFLNVGITLLFIVLVFVVIGVKRKNKRKAGHMKDQNH